MDGQDSTFIQDDETMLFFILPMFCRTASADDGVNDYQVAKYSR